MRRPPKVRARRLSALVALAAADPLPAAGIGPPEPEPSAYALAEEAYAALAARRRKEAARLFSRALAADPAAPQAAAWAAETRALADRWSAAAYTLVRPGEPVAETLAPILGGGQTGAAIAFRPMPLDWPVSIVARATVAHDSGDRDGALGLSLKPWRTLPITIDVERRWTSLAPSEWLARVAGGTWSTGEGWDWSGYAEAGIVGTDARILYAAGQARGGRVLGGRLSGLLAADLGGGAWAGVQRSSFGDVTRLHLGPSLRLRAGAASAVELQLDWRFRLAGNARPRSGPALTLAGQF